ncbi:TetR/AcrR family transcriptional regulator [Mycetocola saprophilus]|uniref:TetR/AcrR family transcriptional regulator n=1 Tax=Mycetocola saprophilus TaxID=76636 RepID=UPI003BF1EA3D
MPPYAYDQNGRRVLAPTKGEQREKSILDEAEKQLVSMGAERMTVESIATAAGITRGALYFYFRSKNDVLAALVQRIVVELTGAVATRQRAIPGSARDALLSAIALTEDLWLRHGAVMRVAVELSPTVPVIATLWNEARESTVQSVIEIVGETAPLGREQDGDMAALSRALISMTERVFYEASAHDTPLSDATATLSTVWLRTLRLE